MDRLLVYFVFLSSIFFVLISRRILFYSIRFFHTFDLNSLRRRLFYDLLFRRLNGTTNLPTYLILILFSLFGLNVFALLFRNTSTKDVAQRAAWISHLILICLGFGSSLSLITQNVLGLDS